MGSADLRAEEVQFTTGPCQDGGPTWTCSSQHHGYLSVAIKTTGGELPDQVTMGTWFSDRTLALVQITQGTVQRCVTPQVRQSGLGRSRG